MPIDPCRTLLARCLQAEEHVLSMYLQAHLSSWFLPICLSPLAGHNILLLNIAGDDAESLADLQVEDHHCSPLSSNPALPSEKAKRLAGQSPLGKSSHLPFRHPERGSEWTHSGAQPAQPLGIFERCMQCLGAPSHQEVPQSP